MKLKTTPVNYSKIVVFEENNFFGYRTKLDSILIMPKYAFAAPFSEKGIALVIDKNTMKYINWKDETLVYPFIFDNGADYFKDGVARFVENEKMGFFAESGKKIIAANYDFAYPFSEGFAAVCNGCKKIPDGEHSYISGGKWGFINKKGTLIIDLIYEEARSFVEKKAQVKQNNKWIVINPKGKKID